MAPATSFPPLKFTALYAGAVGTLFALLSFTVVVFRAIQAQKMSESSVQASPGGIKHVIRVMPFGWEALKLCC